MDHEQNQNPFLIKSLHQKKLKNTSAENHFAYKEICKKITQMIRREKKQTNLKSLGLNSTPGTTDATPKLKEKPGQSIEFAPEANEIESTLRHLVLSPPNKLDHEKTDFI